MSSKNDILFMLEKSRGNYVSGSSLADTLGISRNAVWKSIKALKDEGYSIASDKSKGYMLNKSCDKLSADGIRAYLKNEIDVIYLETVDSTNNEAKRIATQYDGRTKLIVANNQTVGRGRMGRSFYSPKDSGLYMTVALKPQFGFTDVVCVTSAAAVCVACSIERLTGLHPMIKWVNDIYINNKKVCGILSEAVTNMETLSLECVIIGIGINISTDMFPDDLRSVASSLNTDVNKSELCADIADNIVDMCSKISDRSFIDEYKRRCLVLGKQITYTQNGVSNTATAVDIDKNGGLVVTSDKGTFTLSSGEISVRLS